MDSNEKGILLYQNFIPRWFMSLQMPYFKGFARFAQLFPLYFCFKTYRLTYKLLFIIINKLIIVR